MAAATDVDVESIEHLDFDAPCKIRVEVVLFGIVIQRDRQCEMPARWSMRCRACGRLGVVCDSHKFSISALASATCECGANGAGRELFTFTPLSVS